MKPPYERKKMNEREIIKESKEVIKTSEANIGIAEASISVSKVNINIAKSNIETAETKLKALDKPELRHGDYGYDRNGRPCLRIYRNVKINGFVVADKEMTFGNDAGSHAVPKIIIGNIYDDLERNQKDLEEFMTDVNKYYFDFENFIHAPIHIAGNWHTIKEAVTHHQKLGQLIATAKRKAKK